MKISVVIPLYNKEKHIRHTIDTVLAQTYKDFELIVVDDGSTDGSADVVKSINDNRIQLIKKQNEGVSTTRNVGIDNATTPYVAFIDADDEWNSGFLEEIASLIQKYPDAGLWATAFSVQERNGEKYELSYPCLPFGNGQGLIENYFLSAMEYSPLCSSSVCVSKDAVAEVGGFPKEVKNGEDLDLWCRIAMKYPIAYSAKPLAVYRRDSENMASRSITTPSYYPFLTEYNNSTPSIIENRDMIEQYVARRQIEAVSASLFLIRNKNLAKLILQKIQFKRWIRKKYYAFMFIAMIPQCMIDLLYRIRAKRIKNYDK